MKLIMIIKQLEKTKVMIQKLGECATTCGRFDVAGHLLSAEVEILKALCDANSL